MENTINIRTGKERLIFSCVFEVIFMTFYIIVMTIVLHKSILHIGLLAIVLSLKAMSFNLIYNWFFDKMDARVGKIPTERSVHGRILHAIGFEIGLVVTSLPIVVWWLDISILQALIMDTVVTLFVVVYTFVFTWGYDRLYPVAQSSSHIKA